MSERGLEKLHRLRGMLLLAAGTLTVIGILFVHSTTSFGESFPCRSARKQIIKAVVALAAFFVVTRIHYRVLSRWAYWIYAALLVVLAGMIVAKVGGINRFVKLLFFQVQPSELMKIALVLALARYLMLHEDLRRLRSLVVPVGLTLVPLVLVGMQPDLGTSLMLPAILLGMLFAAGARKRYLVLAVLLGIGTVPAVYHVALHFENRVPLLRGYQLERIRSFMEQDERAQQTELDHLTQSKVAIGSGGLTGKGFGKGTQNTLRWVPERHTDFIYSIIAEEWGFVGAAGVTSLFLVLVLLLLRVALLTRDLFGRLAVSGIAIAFAAQSVENMGMTLGLTPITGIPLPFVSHGGSSLVTSYVALAIAFNVASREVRVSMSPAPGRRRPSTGPVLVSEPAAGLLRGRWPVD